MQRKIYDERRKTFIPKNGLAYLEISYADFIHEAGKRIVRNEEEEGMKTIKIKLRQFLR